MTGPNRATLPIATGRQAAGALWRGVRRHPGLALATVVLTSLTSITVVITPVILGEIVDAVTRGESMSGVLPLILSAAASAAAAAVLTGLSSRQAEKLGATIAADLREEVFDRSLRLDSQVLEKVGAGDVTSRVTEDVEFFVGSMSLAARVFTALVTVIWSAIGFLALDWRLALAFAAVLPVYAIALALYLPKAGPLFAAERRTAAERSRVLLSSLEGVDVVHTYGTGDLQTARVDKTSTANLAIDLRLVRIFSIFGLSMNGAEAVGLSALLVTGHFLVVGDIVTVGAVTAAALLFHRLFGPLGMLLMTFDEVQRAGAALARMVGVTLIPMRSAPAPAAPQGQVVVAVTGLTHSYDGVRQAVESISVKVPAGTSLAVVGTSGAGKSTLAALIGGAFPATAGQVSFADRSTTLAVDRVDAQGLRDWVGIVTQETHVFTGTVREDVLLAAPGADDEKVWAALRVAGAAEWVAALPANLDTVVGPGEHALTAVQIQQLALARLVLRNPPVVVLDEATAEAGSAGARDLELAAGRVVAGRTAVVVAHRLTQARACDRIAVMEQGRIVELGSHDELVHCGGRYAMLWRTWSGAGDLVAWDGPDRLPAE